MLRSLVSCLCFRFGFGGGLAITTEGSILFREMFSVAPPKIVEGRPESIAITLRWLLPKEELLAKLANKDLEHRNLGDATRDAVASLSNQQYRVYRRLNYDMVQRGLHMFYKSKKVKKLLPEYTFDEIVDNAIDILTTTGIDETFLGNHSITDDMLLDKGWLEFSTVRILVYLACGGDEAVALTFLDDAAQYHLRIVSRMATHIQLNSANIGRSTWLFGQMLCTRPNIAQEGAIKVLEHLARAKEDIRAHTPLSLTHTHHK